MKTLVTPVEALEIILHHAKTVPAETVDHSDALGRTLARDLIAPIELPPFDNSAMDGYAVIAADLATATEQTPVLLTSLETIGAGEVAKCEVTSGNCLKIMTGAPLPAGADAVVMREDTREEGAQEPGSKVKFLLPVKTGQNIRRAGSDVARGEAILHAGTPLGAAQWAMLASLGQNHVEVTRKPRVGIIATGAELVSINAPLKAGQIRDSNSYALRALAEECGSLVTAVRHAGDTPAQFETVLREVSKVCDVVLTSGGVSAGDFDPVRDVLRDQAEVFFWKIAMKPGKPVMFAAWGETLVFGLPGNPVSVMVAFEEFARPALLQMSGRRALKRIEVPVRIKTAFSSPAGRVEYVRAQLKLQSGEWIAQIDEDQNSGRLSTLTRANALLVVPALQTSVQAGDTLMARLIDCPEIDS